MLHSHLLVAFSWSVEWWLLLLGLNYVLAIVSVPSILLQRRGQPHSAVSWLLVLFAFPWFGIFLWWAIGRKHLERQRRRRRKAAAHTADTMMRVGDDTSKFGEADPGLLPIQRMPIEEAEWVFPPTKHNRLRLLVNATEAYPAMEAAIASAKQHIHITFYSWNDDATGSYWRDLLIERVKSGIHVRLLLDGLGSRFAFRHRLMR